jgi:hypothetical protein
MGKGRRVGIPVEQLAESTGLPLDYLYELEEKFRCVRVD